MKPKLKLAIGAAVLAGLVAAGTFLNIREGLQNLLRWVNGLGPWGPPAFVLVYALATILFVPGFILSLGAGVVFGVLRGSALVLLGATLGATGSFLIARHLAREWVARKIQTDARFAAIDAAVAAGGWRMVGLLRLSPLVPFNVLNYALGLTRVSLRDYFIASALGMLPATVMYVYAGSVIGDVGNLGDDRPKSLWEWLLYATGLVATVVVAIYTARAAKRHLAGRIQP